MAQIKRIVVEYTDGSYWRTHPTQQYTINPTTDKPYSQYVCLVAAPVSPDQVPPGPAPVSSETGFRLGDKVKVWGRYDWGVGELIGVVHPRSTSPLFQVHFEGRDPVWEIKGRLERVIPFFPAVPWFATVVYPDAHKVYEYGAERVKVTQSPIYTGKD